jgi:hypothetical protein
LTADCTRVSVIDQSNLVALEASNQAVIVERWRKGRPIVSFNALNIYEDAILPAIGVSKNPTAGVVSQIVSALEINTVIHTLYLDYKFVLPTVLERLLHCVSGSLRRLSVCVHSSKLFGVIASSGIEYLEELTLSHGTYDGPAIASLLNMLKVLPFLFCLAFYDPCQGGNLLSQLPHILDDKHCSVVKLKLLHVQCSGLSGRQSWSHLNNLCRKVGRLRYLHWEVISSEYTPFVRMSDVLSQSCMRHLLIRADMSTKLAEEVCRVLYLMPLAVTFVGLPVQDTNKLQGEVRKCGGQPTMNVVGLKCTW